MAGGLLQLAAHGVQDEVLFGQPDVTMFKTVFRRYTNFSSNIINLVPKGPMAFGKTTTCVLEKNGDLLGRLYLQIDLPPIYLIYSNTPEEAANQILRAVGINTPVTTEEEGIALIDDEITRLEEQKVLNDQYTLVILDEYKFIEDNGIIVDVDGLIDRVFDRLIVFEDLDVVYAFLQSRQSDSDPLSTLCSVIDNIYVQMLLEIVLSQEVYYMFSIENGFTVANVDNNVNLRDELDRVLVPFYANSNPIYFTYFFNQNKYFMLDGYRMIDRLLGTNNVIGYDVASIRNQLLDYLTIGVPYQQNFMARLFEAIVNVGLFVHQKYVQGSDSLFEEFTSTEQASEDTFNETNNPTYYEQLLLDRATLELFQGDLDPSIVLASTLVEYLRIHDQDLSEEDQDTFDVVHVWFNYVRTVLTNTLLSIQNVFRQVMDECVLENQKKYVENLDGTFTEDNSASDYNINWNSLLFQNLPQFVGNADLEDKYCLNCVLYDISNYGRIQMEGFADRVLTRLVENVDEINNGGGLWYFSFFSFTQAEKLSINQFSQDLFNELVNTIFPDIVTNQIAELDTFFNSAEFIDAIENNILFTEDTATQFVYQIFFKQPFTFEELLNEWRDTINSLTDEDILGYKIFDLPESIGVRLEKNRAFEDMKTGIGGMVNKMRAKLTDLQESFPDIMFLEPIEDIVDRVLNPPPDFTPVPNDPPGPIPPAPSSPGIFGFALPGLITDPILDDTKQTLKPYLVIENKMQILFDDTYYKLTSEKVMLDHSGETMWGNYTTVLNNNTGATILDGSTYDNSDNIWELDQTVWEDMQDDFENLINDNVPIYNDYQYILQTLIAAKVEGESRFPYTDLVTIQEFVRGKFSDIPDNTTDSIEIMLLDLINDITNAPDTVLDYMAVLETDYCALNPSAEDKALYDGLYGNIDEDFLNGDRFNIEANYNNFANQSDVVNYMIDILKPQASFYPQLEAAREESVTVDEAKVNILAQFNNDTENQQIVELNVAKVGVTAAFNRGEFGNGAWVRRLGHYLLERIDLKIGDQLIDRHYGEWLEIWYQLTEAFERDRGYQIMIGDVPQLTTYDNNPKPTYRLYIPLKFWFCKFVSSALPMVNLFHSEVRLDVTLAKFSDVFYHEANTEVAYQTKSGQILSLRSSSPEIKTSYVVAEYIYLESDERQKLASSKQEALIEQLQRHGPFPVNRKEVNYKLDFQNPCKLFVWVVQQNRFVDGSLDNGQKQWVNYSNSTSFTGNPMEFGGLKFNGKNRIGPLDGSYFNYVQPYQNKFGTPAPGVNSYSLCLTPERLQPSGAANMSRIDDSTIEFIISDENPIDETTGRLLYPGVLRIYALSYNVLRIMSGLAGLAFIYGA